MKSNIAWIIRSSCVTKTSQVNIYRIDSVAQCSLQVENRICAAQRSVLPSGNVIKAADATSYLFSQLVNVRLSSHCLSSSQRSISSDTVFIKFSNLYVFFSIAQSYARTLFRILPFFSYNPPYFLLNSMSLISSKIINSINAMIAGIKVQQNSKQTIPIPT